MRNQPADLNEIPEWWKVFEPNGGKPYVGTDGWCSMGNGTRAIIESVMRRGGYIKYLAAVNHWNPAILVHTANYPQAAHFCDKMENTDPKVAVPCGYLDIFTAGIKCTHFSRAAGGRPRSEQERMDAYQVLRWMTDLDVKALVVENVPEFPTWGPLDSHGHPIKRLLGSQFNAWVANLQAMNYKVQWKVLTACWYGDPTSRERFWLIAKKNNASKIYFPEPIYRNPNKPADMFNQDLPTWPVAFDIIDWSLPTKSIFGSDLVPNSLSRILAGADKFAGSRLEFPALPGCPPLPKPKAQFKTAANGKQKRVARVSPYVQSAWNLHYLNMAIRASKGLKLAVKNKKFVKRVHPDAMIAVKQAIPIGQPQMQHDNEFAIKLYGTSITASMDDPMPSITAQGNHLGLIMVNRGGNDGYERNSGLNEPIPGLTTQNPISLINFMIPRHGEHEGLEPRTHSIDEEMPSITPSNNPTLISYLYSGEHVGNGEDRIASANEAMKTLTGTPDWAVAAFLTRYNDAGGRDRIEPLDEPLPNIDTSNRYLAAFLATYYGNEETSTQPVSDALRTVPTKDRFMLVVPTKQGNRLLDIQYRMLVMRELARAHSVEPNFKFNGVKDDAGKKMIGGSWPQKMGNEVVCAAMS